MKTRTVAAFLVAMLVAAALLATCPLNAQESVPAASWPEFHGPTRDNISPEKGLLKQWPEGGPRLIWKFSECGNGYSGVTIADGMIFTAGDFGDEEVLLALDMQGKLLWRSPSGSSWTGASPGSRATPTYNEGRLYHLTPSGRLAAFEAKGGKEVWAVDLKADFGARWGVWALAENVVVDGDKVLCVPGGTKGVVVALDKRTGKTLWANTELDDRAAYCSPNLVTYQGVRQLITMTNETVIGIDVASGKLLWKHPFPPKSPQHATTPVFRDGHVFVAAGHGKGATLLKISPDLGSAAEVWSRTDFDNCHGGVILVDGRLYGCGCRLGGKAFFCVDFLTGKERQKDMTLGKVAMTCADGMLYCLNHNGRMYLLEITPEGFRIASRFELPKRPDNSYLAHPVVCGGRLYLRYEQNLWAYDIKAK